MTRFAKFCSVFPDQLTHLQAEGVFRTETVQRLWVAKSRAGARKQGEPLKWDGNTRATKSRILKRLTLWKTSAMFWQSFRSLLSRSHRIVYKCTFSSRFSVVVFFFVRWLCLLCQAKLCSGSFRLEGTTAFSTTRSSKSGGKVWSSSSTSKPEHMCVFLLTQVQVHQATMQDLQLHLRRIK